jgi:flagellar hook-basal body complex protein FliE
MILPITTGNFTMPTLPNTTKTDSSLQVPFANMLDDAISNLKQLEQVKTEDAYALSIGEVDDPSVLAINSLKYDTALSLLVQTRDRLLNSYNELMRMSF